jgi:hypothetical protein
VRTLRRAALLGLAGWVLAACSPADPTSTQVASDHAAHDPQADRVVVALEAERQMTFEPAGPHHRLGVAPDGVELDLVGVPVVEIVLSIPADDPELGHAYLPHLRDLLHGPDRVYDWVAAMLACRVDPERTCEERFSQGNLEAAFSDGGPDYVVVSLSHVRG